MNYNGHPAIPPTRLCPQNMGGRFIENLHMASFSLHTLSGADNTGETPDLMSIYGTWRDGNNQATTTILDLSSDDPLVHKTQRILEKADLPNDNPEDDPINQIDGLFCSRVLECKGIIDGECDALGTRAVREVLGQIDT